MRRGSEGSSLGTRMRGLGAAGNGDTMTLVIVMHAPSQGHWDDNEQLDCIASKRKLDIKIDLWFAGQTVSHQVPRALSVLQYQHVRR